MPLFVRTDTSHTAPSLTYWRARALVLIVKYSLSLQRSIRRSSHEFWSRFS